MPPSSPVRPHHAAGFSAFMQRMHLHGLFHTCSGKKTRLRFRACCNLLSFPRPAVIAYPHTAIQRIADQRVIIQTFCAHAQRPFRAVPQQIACLKIQFGQSGPRTQKGRSSIRTYAQSTGRSRKFSQHSWSDGPIRQCINGCSDILTLRRAH